MIAGCYDRFYGPTLVNASGDTILLRITPTIGVSRTASWPPGRCRFLDMGSGSSNPLQEVRVLNQPKELRITEERLLDLAADSGKSVNDIIFVVTADALVTGYKSDLKYCTEVRRK